MLRMSTKGHHATRIVIFLAGSSARPVSKAEIGEAEAIPPGYLQQIMVRLTDAGLVRSHRGKMGGFTLARPPADITVLQVLRATEGPFELAPCVESVEPCERMQTCPAHLLWSEATAMIDGLFERTTVADLVASGHRLQEEYPQAG
jgi:Rrf2 family protein